MKTAVNLLTLVASTAVLMMVMGLIARLYSKLFLFGWGVL